ncbi:MAG: M14 family metallopeptidase [Candidatus Eisenbacteria bacterium]|nr:M14 family metallopeptidase [Candidatus Eisenbacteria bacterium]
MTRTPQLFPMARQAVITMTFASIALAFPGAPAHGQSGKPAVAPALGAMGVPANPKVFLRWDAFHDVAGIGAAMKAIAEAHPDLARFSSIGKSFEGRDLHLITITSFKSGGDTEKPAIWIDANIHGNEVQGSEVALYTAWYLTEMYGQVAEVTELLDRATFYIVPSINPDGRDGFIREPNNRHSSRGGKKPWDNDNDGLLDEDGPDDLDGDGNICEMRIKDAHGRSRPDPDDPRRMIPAKPDEPGLYTLLDDEGLDNDGDGRVNEDGMGGYDPNRNWPGTWQPAYVQSGAHDYPGSLPETRAVLDFVISHPNIGAAQSYHNAGGMILRGPGHESLTYEADDIGVFDVIGNAGEKILPGYRYLITWKDLYSVSGGELDWFYLGRGILAFTNELFTAFNYFRDDEFRSNGFDGSPELTFDRMVLLREAFVEWKPYDHPQYGLIEIGGTKKNFGRVPPGFLLPEECHRNMAFTLYHAMQLPRLVIDEPVVTTLSGGLKRIRITVANETNIPTRTAQDVAKKITPEDRASLSGGSLSIVSSGRLADRYGSVVTPISRKEPAATIRYPRVGGMDTVTLEWLARGSGEATVTVQSARGGTVRRGFRVP